MMRIYYSFLLILPFLITNCADDKPYLEGYIRRADDGILIHCDPYNNNKLHSCVVYASSFQDRLWFYDATDQELVLAPLGFMPLSVKVGPATDTLSEVKSANPKFPYFLALGRADSVLYVVRSFPSEDKKSLSFSTPLAHKIEDMAYKIAALDTGKMTVVFISYPHDGSISLQALDSKTGEVIAPPKKIKIAGKPSYIEIDNDRKIAVISNQDTKQLSIIDLSTIEEVIASEKEARIAAIDIGIKSDRIHLSKRDFGQGEKHYALLLNAEADEIKLVNLDDNKVEAGFGFSNEYPMALYFPESGSTSCCNNREKNWIAVAGIKGNLFHLRIKHNNNKLSMEIIDDATVELGSVRNMSLHQIHVRKILGGEILVDSPKSQLQCLKNRQMFLITSYASNRLNPRTLSSLETEGQGRKCMDESSVSRLSIREN